MIQATRSFTLADWSTLDEDDTRELVDGQLVEGEVADFIHDLIVFWLAQQLRNWLQGKGSAGTSRFALSPRRGRIPDLAVFLPGTKLPPARGLVSTPPDIMIEVLSATPRDHRRDRLEKMREYLEFGVRYYWILDPEARTLEIYERTPDAHYLNVAAAGEGKLAIPGCENLTLDLDEIWAEIDRLPNE